MRDATIATSRTRATTDNLIDYRPLPAQWGDLEALHAVRAEKARAAERGEDASILEIAATPGGSHHEVAGRHRDTVGPRRDQAGSRRARGHGLWATLRREAGAHRRRGHGGGRYVAA